VQRPVVLYISHQLSICTYSLELFF